MKEHEYLETISNLSDDVLGEEIDIITKSCIRGCSTCKHRFDGTTRCKLEAIIQILKERI